ncbi:HNH endonuclease family protein [Streptomyces sp. NPDC050504]|uniref:HNH endonuclease family protein n=1 Tax=Streptomyces sp. NPDC050504 TaxID=3365618 RepID=UPI0037904005
MRVRRLSGCTAVAAALLLAVTGCGSDDKADDAKGSGGKGGSSASPSAPAPGGSGKTDGPGGTDGPKEPEGTASPAPGTPGNAKDVLPGMVDAAVARTQLAALRTGEPGTMQGYSRARFPHWSEQGKKCDTRETVLARDGKDVERNAECKATGGTWVSLYDGLTVTDAAKLDIDHMVPLAEAWRSGARAWTDEQRKGFANDLTRPQLLAVTARTNRSKGDQSPALWQPPAKESWCQYGRAWTTVKSHYELTVTEAERTKLGEMLDTCGTAR